MYISTSGRDTVDAAVSSRDTHRVMFNTRIQYRQTDMSISDDSKKMIIKNDHIGLQKTTSLSIT